MTHLIKPTLHETYTTPNKAYTTPNAGTYITPNKDYLTLNSDNETNLDILTIHTAQNNVESTFDINENDNNTFLEPRRSNRTHKVPSHLSDYVCNSSIWCNLISFSALPYKSQVFLGSQAKWSEPGSYTAAAKESKWKEVVQKELDAFELNNTWENFP